MLRRFARALRWALFCVGAGLLVWLPFAVTYTAYVAFRYVTIGVGSDATLIVVQGSDAEPAEVRFALGTTSHEYRRWMPPVTPFYEHGKLRALDVRVTVVSIPTWYFIVLCLAWPVTSFILHRRRHKRGFPIEPNASASEAPKPRQ